MVATLLAIAKAGAAYLPLDPALPAQRFALIIEDARPAALFTQRDLKAVLSDGRRAASCSCDDSAAGDAPMRDIHATPDSLAYVLYTSGSTGKPKGVEIPHRALVNLLASMQREAGLRARPTSLLAVTTLSFDIAALELFLPLVSGGTRVLADRETAADPPAPGRADRRRAAGRDAGDARDLARLIEAGWRGATSSTILCGGEALPRDLADQLLPRCAALWNMYGPTETTIWSTVERVDAGRAPASPIGTRSPTPRSISSIRSGNPVPVGCRRRAAHRRRRLWPRLSRSRGADRGALRRAVPWRRTSGFTAPAISAASAPTARSNAWAAPIIR